MDQTKVQIPSTVIFIVEIHLTERNFSTFIAYRYLYGSLPSLHVFNQLLLLLLLLSGRRRRSTNKEKFVFLRCINEFVAARISINEACKELNIHDRQYRYHGQNRRA